MDELFDNVTYYGINKIIRNYCHFPSSLPLPVSIQHGWSFVPSLHDARVGASENWYWSDAMAKAYKAKYPEIKTRAVGAPFLYFLKVISYEVMPEETRKGSIVFPSHSSSLARISCDYNQYAEMLSYLPDIYKPVTICMYHIDFERGMGSPFASRGFKIVSNGDSLYEENFLLNFVNNSRDKLYAFSNQMTSALLFASAMDLKAFYYGPPFQFDSQDPNFTNIADYDQRYKQWEINSSNYFQFPDVNILDQQKFSRETLGEENLLSPIEMFFLLSKLAVKKQYLRQVLPDDHLAKKVFRLIKRALIKILG